VKIESKGFLRSLSFAFVCLLLGVLIAIQLKSVNSTENQLVLQNKRTDELRDELITLQNSNRDLSDRYSKLKDYVAALESQTASTDDALKAILDEKRKAEVYAGLTDVSGPGVIVTLSAGAESSIRDLDVRMVVNELRAAGAQAISVNQERMVAMSEIRLGGQYIVINGKPFPSNEPFEIRAITRPDDTERALTMLNGVADTLTFYSIDTSIVKMDKVEIPKLREDSPAYQMDMLN
jgi:uncharacterized protein YlxW (UPF0749 family)